MLVKGLLPLLALVKIAVSLPAAPVPPSEGLRLVKFSEDDEGTWVTEDQKFDLFISKKINFVDVTDTWQLEEFGATTGSSLEARQISFPSGPTHQSQANPLIAVAGKSNPQSWTNTFTSYNNRYYRSTTGVTSATWLYNTIKNIGAANSAITVTQYSHSASGFSQQSVIAKIPGTSSATVVIGAHLDSVGTTTSGRAPGADDNNSGTVTILEAFRVLANAKFAPTNTLEFHWYAGEEGGLLGSRAIFNSYASAGRNIKAVLVQDMTGYSPNNVIAVYTDYVSTALTNFIKTIVPVYTSLPVITDVCGYGCSDHASANSAGYPASFVTEDTFDDSSPYIHSASDTVSTLDFDHILEHIKLTIGFAVEASYF
ncbi:uncharacterized protein LAJ45_00695 [Morchella importuna]|uniref:Peptide hydrolase n=1 Tax=Morchella conica CCBAS932 TaxID=1392247 RepID=A0A3N4L0F3_9PEZI|nr:uncharacterized protein LAJ45_00695 [Morchella importuna]KAH8155685.1 hypothetical protein LAJ45_00695 [Morchella importuna]RPB16287.1 Zn-dependent exopeptidase [Morchella conica CCBAS932]